MDIEAGALLTKCEKTTLLAILLHGLYHSDRGYTPHNEREKRMHLTNIRIASLAVALCVLCARSLTAQTPLPAEAQKPVLSPSKIAPENPLGLSADHVTIWVADAEKESEWYKNMLGFAEVQHRSQPDNEFRQMRIPGVYRIDLTWWKGSSRHVDTKDAAMEQGYRHIVFKAQDLKAALEQLTKKNANVRAQRDKDGGLVNVFVLDPEGNEIELQQY
jgi:catechol 2,3-dioxygenase-like lactoylglutathione lyase family enzyme